MTDNPLKRSGPAAFVPKPLEQQMHEGNERLAAMGRHDVHWYMHEGELKIGFKPLRPVSHLRVIGRD